MKRSNSVEKTYKPKGYEVQKKCVICRTVAPRLHRITSDEADQIFKLYNIVVKAEQRACCRHWAPHTRETFTTKYRPPLQTENAIQGTTPSKRKSPVARQPIIPPAKPLEERSQKQLAALVTKQEKEIEALKSRIEELEALTIGNQSFR
jgi:hypothetical protein